MKTIIVMLLTLVVLFGVAIGQEKPKEEMPSIAPPQSLDVDMHK